MKRIILITGILVGWSTMVLATDVITKHFKEQFDTDNTMRVSVSKKMFELFTEIEPGDEHEKEILEAISKLDGFKAFGIEGDDPLTHMDGAIKKIMSDGFEELMSVKDKEQSAVFLIKEEDGLISELVMVMAEKKQFVVMSLYGEIDLKNVSKLTKSLNISGMNHFKDLPHPPPKSKDKKEDK